VLFCVLIICVLYRITLPLTPGKTPICNSIIILLINIFGDVTYNGRYAFNCMHPHNDQREMRGYRDVSISDGV
jgi:hypothetical protein